MTKTKEEYNEYMRVCMLRRYHERMEVARLTLGGRCSLCSTMEGPFDLDHIDPKTKEFTGARMWSGSKSKFEAELAKCQLLCKPCHERKTISDLGKKVAKGTHGTLSSYRYCKCDLCKRAQSDYMREYNSRLRSGTATGPDF